MTVLVCPLSKVAELVTRHEPSRVISLLDPAYAFPDLGPRYEDRHLRLSFHDVHEPASGVVPPARRHVEEILAFLSGTRHDESLLVHCRAGIGRSTATAFVIACWRNPKADELTVARVLREVAPLARPNETLVRLADAAMNRQGRMSEAIRSTGVGLPWIEVEEGRPFRLPATFEGGRA